MQKISAEYVTIGHPDRMCDLLAAKLIFTFPSLISDTYFWTKGLLFFLNSVKYSCHKVYGFFILLSLAFYIVSCIPSITTKEETPVIRDDYVSYAHDTFSCIVSILLYIFSLRIRKMIRIWQE